VHRPARKLHDVTDPVATSQQGESSARPRPPPRPAPKRRSWLRLILFGLVAILIVGFGFEGLKMVGERSSPVSQAASGPPLVRVAAAERGARETTLSLPGDITAFEEAPVYARVNGYISKWTVDIGARVKAGELLAEIETPELHQSLRQAQALVLQAKANAEIARITFNRYLGLVKTNAVSQQDVDNSRAAHEARLADVAAAEAEVGRINATIAFQKIYAPFDGIVGARNLAKATTGALIDLGSGDAKAWLYKIYRMDPVRVYVTMPQAYLPMIKDGLAADVVVREYPDRTFKGKVVRNAASLNATSRTMLVEVEAPNPDGILLPGLYSTIHFKLINPAPPIVVADSSIIVLDGAPQIAIVDKDDVVQIRKVRLGRDFGRSVEVLSGCDDGDRVVVNPSDLLKNGTKVRARTGSP
jgi:RND family efflux transporter MFP subunit